MFEKKKYARVKDGKQPNPSCLPMPKSCIFSHTLIKNTS
jgi:hypothetical protein